MNVVRWVRQQDGAGGKFLQTPLKQRFPTFHYRTSFFCCFPIFSSLEPSKSPPKDKQDFNRWASSELFIENCFFGRLSHFSAFEPIIQNPKSTCTSNGPAPFPSSETSPRKHECSPFPQSQPSSVRVKSPQSRFADNHKQDFIS